MLCAAALLILFAAFTPWACLAQETCYVKPRNDTLCPGEPCFTLSQFTHEKCNASNITLHFLNGTHYLNNRIEFTDIENISLLRAPQSSDSQVRIECTDYYAYFEFSEIDNLHISGFDFVFYGFSLYWGIVIDTVRYCQLSNFSLQRSGGMLINNSTVSFSGNTKFENNYYSAVFVHSSTVTFTGKCNSAGGGAFSGNTSFVNNWNRAVVVQYNSTVSFSGNTSFVNNWDSAVVVQYDSTVAFNGKCNFACNSAIYGRGGALLAYENAMLTFTGTNTFINNSADHGGGAVFISDSSTLTFAGNVSFVNNSAQHGGGIFTENSCRIDLLGNSHFTMNQGKEEGGAVYAVSSNISLLGINHFEGNTAKFGGSIWVEKSHVYFMGTNNFSSNMALGGGGIYAWESALNFGGAGNRFENNSAQNGSALSLSADTKYILQPNTTLHFRSNRAEQFGGAIRVEVVEVKVSEYCTKNLSSFSVEERCFFNISNGDFEHSHVKMIFKDNEAGKAGSVLFGGTLDTCLQVHQDAVVFDIFENDTKHVLNSIADFETNITTSMISSYPFKVCACDEHSKEINCTNSYINISAYPGQRFIVSAAVVDSEEKERAVPAIVQVLQGGDKIRLLQTDTRVTNKICSVLEFAVSSESDNGSETVSLSPEGLCYGLNNFSVNVKLKRCPRGFIFSDEKTACDCEPRLQQYTTCNIDDQTILHTERFWFGFDNESGGNGLILYKLCPFYYCVGKSLNVSVNDTDMQCDSNRGGLLCGKCKPGFSLILGNPHCWECSNRYLALLIPFAFAGVGIVLLLYVFDLTVPHGTLSGLIFYANIISVTWRAFPREDYFFPRMFIAWLNLDLGIETCFYNGLDAYVKTWLELVFPIYIWALVGVIVIISRYSTKVTKLLGTNSVSVLATLLLLSYTKVLRTIIVAFPFATLEYPNETHMVWLYDANIEYLKGKHILLFVAALMLFLLLFTPYTLFLIFGQWLLAKSHLRMFNWVNRLKPFFDAYHNPYKPKHRYWPGLLLLVRCILSVALALNIAGNPTLDFLFVCIGAIVVLTWGRVAGRVYENWYLDALEASFVLNLGIFAASIYQTVTKEGDTIRVNDEHIAIPYVFTGVAFVEFLGILAYHIYLKFRRAKPNMNRKQLQVSLKELVYKRNSSKEEDTCHAESSFANGEGIESSCSPTVSYVSFSTSENTDASDPQLSLKPSDSFYDAALVREPLLNEQS